MFNGFIGLVGVAVYFAIMTRAIWSIDSMRPFVFWSYIVAAFAWILTFAYALTSISS